MLKQTSIGNEIEYLDCTNCPKNEDLEIHDKSFLPRLTCAECLEKGRPAKPRERGNRLPQGVVKKEILEYLLNQNSYVGMPAIREHLMYKLGISDQKTIRKHLDDLTADKYIFYRSVTSKGIDRWAIINFSQLQRVKNKFPEIKLNNKFAALNIVANKSAFKEGYLTNERLLRLLRASRSLFDKFFNQSTEEILREARRLYFFDYDTEFDFTDSRIVPKNYVTVKMVILNLLLHCVKTDLSLGNQMDNEERNRWKCLGEVIFSPFFTPDERINMTPEEFQAVLDKEEIVNYDKEDFDHLSKNRNLSFVLGLMRERKIDLD